MIRQRVRDVVAQVFDRSPDSLPPVAGPDTVEGWTSLRHLRVILGLEEEFGIEIEPDAVPGLVTDEAMAGYLTEHLTPAAGADR
ncbi:acyl carrier protein [Micromonospora sp. WMMD1082]|uniref:acyl carrier protein n=1 Tax=Micromonospora sp. WMMD1082 TaxID=3016104 RepID=UPI00241718FE|nr:acyl carrier protein [Micromonospora sp. WMMD1082]MDG4794540.1 acyl carrier protein [Micromonospora sp. WMMD1082]